MKNVFSILLFCFFFLPLIVIASPKINKPIKVGWIGGMTGPTAKWGAYQAAVLGVEDVNSNGGINGRKLELIYEDAHCNSSATISSYTKLIKVNKVSFILGGHCSSESLAFAPLAERDKIISIAATTSSPKLSDMGDYIFRVTPISTRLAELLAPYAYTNLKIRKMSFIYELTDYVVPVVERFKEIFTEKGGRVTSEVAFNSGEVDFGSILLKATKGKPEAIYIGVQAPDTVMLLIKKIKELQLTQRIFGNEQFAGALLDRELLDGIIFAEPQCDYSSTNIESFSEKYKKKYKVKSLPFGCYTGEPYDTVQLLAGALRKCGEKTECVKQELYKIKDYQGASGNITFNSKGDVEKKYLIKIIDQGEIKSLNNKN